MARQVLDSRRAVVFDTGLSRVKVGEPRVSDVSESGRTTECLRLDDFGEARELPLGRVLAGERWLLKENASEKGDLGEVGLLMRGG